MEIKPTVDHYTILVNGRIIDLDTLQVEVRCVIAIQHPSSQVWNILACIAFPGDVNFVSLHTKSLGEPFPEIIELI